MDALHAGRAEWTSRGQQAGKADGCFSSWVAGAAACLRVGVGRRIVENQKAESDQNQQIHVTGYLSGHQWGFTFSVSLAMLDHVIFRIRSLRLYPMSLVKAAS